ncbi:hypothetical protein MU821_03790 [Salmonella enterica subsp. enterica serovar Enteritidis]|nr:hypothetical protein [Salmonella enterica subsp. enterica serovar Enteritidis]
MNTRWQRAGQKVFALEPVLRKAANKISQRYK